MLPLRLLLLPVDFLTTIHKSFLIIMKVCYRLSKVCGSVYSNGNLLFTPDGNTILSCIGNRVSLFDLINHTTITLPIENNHNIYRIAISNNGIFLITIDITGHALIINVKRRIVLLKFNFKKKIRSILFSKDDRFFIITYGNGCQIWKTPSVTAEFAPLSLIRNITGFNNETTCTDWSADNQTLILGSKDLTARIYYRILSKKMSMTVLSGHRDVVIGCYLASDNETAYTIARDGAIFTWIFEKRARVEQVDKYKDKEEDDNNNQDSKEKKSLKGSKWVLKDRKFLWESQVQVSSTAFNKSTNLLVIGFTSGVFALYEMPGCVSLHRLSISNTEINAACINSTGEWIGLGSTILGQLLVWEWKSETFVMKQQGHLYGLNAIDFSSDGQYIVTAGEDSKVKLWNSSSGFCFITFSAHTAPVTGVKFVGHGHGRAVISSSLDGTVRAHDLLRYKNFRTMITPTPVQFTSLAVESTGSVVCAGSLDPFNIYVWSLQTGSLLDILAGHEGPIACLEFSSTGSTLASGSWDGTLKLWDVYKNTCVETMEHGCDVLAVAFRPDGKEVCTASTNGNLTFWDTESGNQTRLIEGRRDISGGRLTTDLVTSQNSERSKYFTSVTYTADGSCVLAGGRSKFVCIYSVESSTLVKKFQLSHNRSLEGVLDELRSDRLVDGVNIDTLVNENDSDNEHLPQSDLPGVAKGTTDGSRITKAEILTAAVRFSPSGREWAAATTQGLQIFSLDDLLLFAPTDLDITITPEKIEEAILKKEYGFALNMALHLGEKSMLKQAVDAIPLHSIPLVVTTIDVNMIRDFLRFIAEEIVASRHLEFYLQWCWNVLNTFNKVLQKDSMSFLENCRALIRAISVHEKDIMKLSDESQFMLSFLLQQQNHQQQLPLKESEEQDGALINEHELEFVTSNEDEMVDDDEDYDDDKEEGNRDEDEIKYEDEESTEGESIKRTKKSASSKSDKAAIASTRKKKSDAETKGSQHESGGKKRKLVK